VFSPNSTQSEVYSHCVEPLLCRVMNGQNASVFAYGPTGSGMQYITLHILISSVSFLSFFVFAFYSTHLGEVFQGK